MTHRRIGLCPTGCLQEFVRIIAVTLSQLLLRNKLSGMTVGVEIHEKFHLSVNPGRLDPA